MEKLYETAKAINGSANRLLLASCDVSQPDAVLQLFEKIKKKFNRLDLLFNRQNAINQMNHPITALSIGRNNFHSISHALNRPKFTTTFNFKVGIV